MKHFLQIMFLVVIGTACSQKRPPQTVNQNGSVSLDFLTGVRSTSQLNALTIAALGVNPPKDFQTYQQLLSRLSNGQTSSTTTRQGNLDHSALACGVVISREANMPSNVRKIFPGVDFNSGTSQFTSGLIQSVAHTLYARSLGRNPTQDELSAAVSVFPSLQSAVASADSSGVRLGDGAQTQLLSQVFCAVIFASVLGTNVYPN